MSDSVRTRTAGEKGGVWSPVAVVRGVEPRVRVVVVEQADRQPRIVAAEEVDSLDAAAAVARRVGVQGGVVWVAPASATVCRSVQVPSSESGGDGDASAEDALSLLAEAQLPEHVAWWRRASGSIGGAASPGMRSGLIAGWLGDRAEPGGAAGAVRGVVAETVALAALVEIGEGGGSGAAVSCAASDGGLAAAGYGVDRCVVRSTVDAAARAEDGASDVAASALRRIHEKLGTSGEHTLVCDDGAGGVLAVDSGVAHGLVGAVQGASEEPQWLARFAACAAMGAKLAAGDAGWRGLAGMLVDEPRDDRGVLARAASWLDSPVRAAVLVLVALVVFAGVPVLGSYLRMSELESRVESYERALGVDDADSGMTPEQRRRMYALLDRERVPMTKVLADIAAALPAESRRELVLADRVSVEAGERFRLEGTTADGELVTEMLRLLGGSEVFADVRLESQRRPSEPGAPVEFVVSGRIGNPFIEAFGVRDYSEYDASAFVYGVITDEEIERIEEERRAAERAAREAERLASDEGSDADAEADERGADLATAESDSAEDSLGPEGVADAGSAASGPRSGRRNGESTRRPARDERIAEELGEDAALADGEEIERGRRELFEGGSRTEQAEAEPEPIPEELTEEQIGELDVIGAMRARLERQRTLRERDDLEPDVRRRLEDEAERLRNRAREAREEAS